MRLYYIPIPTTYEPLKWCADEVLGLEERQMQIKTFSLIYPNLTVLFKHFLQLMAFLKDQKMGNPK